MQINVAQQLKLPVGSSRSYEINYSPGEGEPGNAVSGKVEFIRTSQGILARGTLSTRNKLVCSRCLKTFDYPTTIEINDEFLPSTDINTGVPVSRLDDPQGFIIDRHHLLDLTEAARQYILLNTPMNPLCHPNCAGLCPQCGADLNQDPCSCVSHTSANALQQYIFKKGISAI